MHKYRCSNNYSYLIIIIINLQMVFWVQVFRSNEKKLHIIMWFQECDWNTSSLHMIIWFQVFKYKWGSVSQWLRTLGFNLSLSHTKDSKKWYLIPPCLTLSIIRYVSRVKWSNPGKGLAPSPTPQCNNYWKGSSPVALDYDCYLYLYAFMWLMETIICKQL